RPRGRSRRARSSGQCRRSAFCVSIQGTVAIRWAVRRYMQAAGWVEGHNVRYDFVLADMSIERMPALASELVARNIDLVVAFGEPAIRAVQQATRRIPIVGMADDIHCHG